MIKKFLVGLPYTLTQPMLREYETKTDSLKRWSASSRSTRIKQYINQRDTLHLIFAMGIYYRYVIAPLFGAASFFERLTASEQAVGLKIGGKTIGPEFQAAIQRSAARFHTISSNFGLPQTFFAEVDVQRIVWKLIEIEERRPDGDF